MAVAMNRTTTNVVTAQLRGRRRDVAGSLFAAALLSALLLSLLILVFLLWDVVRTGWPVLADRGVHFLTAGPSSFPAQAGIGALWRFAPHFALRLDLDRNFDVGKTFALNPDGNGHFDHIDAYTLNLLWQP